MAISMDWRGRLGVPYQGSKNAENDCGFWSEHYFGHWHEDCLALGRCTDNPANCPLEIAKSLVKSLEVAK